MLDGMADGREHLRAADADRQSVADRLRRALDEGRLDFHEYDGRLQQAYAAKTYGDLDRLVVDLPDVAPAERSALAPVPSAASVPAGTSAAGQEEFPNATRRWLLATWDEYLAAVPICMVIWLISVLTSNSSAGFWALWVAGPWGAYLAYETFKGLTTGEPQRWAAREARKRAAKLEKRERRHTRRLAAKEHRLHDDPDAAEA
jgi:hypothetical protein